MGVNEDNLKVISFNDCSIKIEPVPQSRTLLKCIVTYVLLTVLKELSAVMPILTDIKAAFEVFRTLF